MQTVEQVKKRIDQLLERDQVTDKELEEVYSQAVDTLRAIVSDVHNRYAVDGVVVPANLYGKVTVKDMLLLKQQYDKLPDDLSAQEQDRVDYYTAMSQTSPRGLITAVIGMALIAVAHKVSKIIQKNNRIAVKEEIAYQAKHENIPKMSVKKYASPEFKVKTGKDFIPWTERVLTDHYQAVNRINNVINSMVSQGMRAEDIANHFYPGNAQSMRADNIPKIIRDATVKAKRTTRTEAAAREDAIVEQTFKANNVKYFDWVTEPGACQKCTFIALSGPYKVGDEDSPRVPESSHPNCRCRRIPRDDSIRNGKMAILLSDTISGAGDEYDLELPNSNKYDDFEVVEDVRSLPIRPDKGGRPNVKIILLRGGKAESIRTYDGEGYAYRDYDLTNHGNSKRHPVVPHVHDWIVDSTNGKIERGKWREPTDEEIKFIEGAIEYGNSRQAKVDK